MANHDITPLARAFCGNMILMARKKKMKRFRAVAAVKALARERIGTVPMARVVPDRKKKKTAKHKETLADMLSEE